MKAKKLFPDLSFKRLWDKIKELENKVGDGSDSEQNKKIPNLEWTHLKTVTGKTSVSLPSEYSELLVSASVNAIESNKIIPKVLLSSGSKTILLGGGYDMTHYGSDFGLSVSLTSLVLKHAYSDSNEVSASTKVSVYYR